MATVTTISSVSLAVSSQINATFYWGDSAENDQLLPAGAECSFQGAARPYRGFFEDRYCYRRDLIAYSDPQLCYITG